MGEEQIAWKQEVIKTGSYQQIIHREKISGGLKIWDKIYLTFNTVGLALIESCTLYK